MKILLAASDRDLLRSYTRLLEADGHLVQPAFDGPQVRLRMDREHYDLLIAEETLPGTTEEEMLRQADSGKTSPVLLTERWLAAGERPSSTLPGAYMRFPFEPEDMRQTIRRVTAGRETA